MDARTVRILFAALLAIAAIVIIRAFGLGVYAFIALLIANSAIGCIGIVRTAMNRRWKPCLVFVAWACFPLVVGLYLLHLWNTLPER